MKENGELGFPNTGCVEAGPEDEVNEKRELEDAPLDDPNIIGAPLVVDEAAEAPNITGELLVVVLAAEVAVKENPVDGVELKPNTGDFGGCQPEPNTLDVLLLLELTKLLSDKEEEPSAGVVPELNGLAEIVEPKGALPEERVVLPVNPNEGEDPEEPNWRGVL